MVQLWVNLPAKDKMATPGYQSIRNADIPSIELADDAGSVRVIAGEFDKAMGPARTFTPMNVWDMRLKRDASIELDLPEGHSAAIVVLTGHVTVGGTQAAGEAEAVLLDKVGAGTTIDADGDSMLLVLTGEPIDEPIVGYGPFVMNSEAEIREAIADFNNGKFGQMVAA